MTGVSDKWKESGNCKFIDYLNVYNNTKVDINNVHFATVKKLKQNEIEQNDILVTTASETSDECGITAVVEGKIDKGIFLDDHLFGMHLKKEYRNVMNSTYINYLFNTYEFRKKVNKIVKGVTRFFITSQDFAKINITVPDITIQNKIVSVLDNFKQICKDLNIGLPAEIEARKKQYEYYRDKLLSFK